MQANLKASIRWKILRRRNDKSLVVTFPVYSEAALHRRKDRSESLGGEEAQVLDLQCEQGCSSPWNVKPLS